MRRDQIVGWREWVALPRVGIARIKAKLDTGARTTALHARDVRRVIRDGVEWVDFAIPHKGRGAPRHQAHIADERAIRNTSGVAQTRIIIVTQLVLGARSWQVEVSLADRERMAFDIILGRTALRRHGVLVNPGRSFLAGEPVGESLGHAAAAPPG